VVHIEVVRVITKIEKLECVDHYGMDFSYQNFCFAAISSDNGGSASISGGILALIILLVVGLCATLTLIFILGNRCKGSSNK